MTAPTPHSNPPDLEGFLRTLRRLPGHPAAEARELFAAGAGGPARDLVVTRAPGRLDLMGGISDYSGSLVLQWPLREATFAALQRSPERMLRIVSLGGPGEAEQAAPRSFTMPLSDLEHAGEPLDYAAAREYFTRDPERHWAAYAAGCFLVLMRERGVRFPEGARLLIASGVPQGKGVSSSAAIEVAVMRAIAAAFDLPLEPVELALLCQQVENRVVGAPCGVMDQMTSACGEQDRLLALLCQPATLCGTLPLPDAYGIWGLDSGIRHAVSGGDYGSVRTAAFMGYEIARARLVDRHGVEPAWSGYLANLRPSEWEQHYASHVPERLTGAEYLARFRPPHDPLSVVAPEREYAVRAAAAHPIHERLRARQFAQLLRQPCPPEHLEEQGRLLGELMFQSHAGYSACGLGSDGTDLLVELVREAGPERGLFGARITGGGSGGTVAVLGRRDAGPAVEAIAAEYAREAGHPPYLFHGSSPGAAAFGWRTLTAEELL